MSRAVYREVYLAPSLRKSGWSELLSEWGRLLKYYSSPDPGEDPDYGYWYGERAVTGFLAAAAWRIRGGWSLQEFANPRKFGSRHQLGRGDLWLATGTGRFRRFTVEAKHTWTRTRTHAKLYVPRLLREAEAQLNTLRKPYRHGSPIALCYIVPNIPARTGWSSAGAKLHTHLLEHSARTCDIVATYWHASDAPAYEGVRYPGVVLVGRICEGWDGA